MPPRAWKAPSMPASTSSPSTASGRRSTIPSSSRPCPWPSTASSSSRSCGRAAAIAAMWKDVGVNVKVEVIEYSVRAQKNREKSYKGVWWSDPTSTLGDPDGMMWRLLGPGGPQDYWRESKFDELGAAARFSVDEKFRGEAYAQ